MPIHKVHCGNLKVKAIEMIKPLSINQIRTHYSVDSKGYMWLSINSVVVEKGDRKVLIDPGVADFLPSRLLREFGLEIPVHIEEELYKIGCSCGQITDVIFTHLHFDHGSGAFLRLPGQIAKRFPNARYHLLKEHYDYATRPDVKDSNSFFTPFLNRIQTIHWLEDWKDDWIEFRIFYGHARGMVVPVIKTDGEVTYFLSDLIPMEIFLKQDVFSGYDLESTLARKEKVDFIKGIRKKSTFIFFHDPLKERMNYP